MKKLLGWLAASGFVATTSVVVLVVEKKLKNEAIVSFKDDMVLVENTGCRCAECLAAFTQN